MFYIGSVRASLTIKGPRHVKLVTTELLLNTSSFRLPRSQVNAELSPASPLRLTGLSGWKQTVS